MRTSTGIPVVSAIHIPPARVAGRGISNRIVQVNLLLPPEGPGAPWRHTLCPCFAVRLLPPEQPGGTKREGGDEQAGDDEQRARAFARRRDPRAPGSGQWTDEQRGDRAAEQRAEVHTKPEPASWGVLRRMRAPVVRETPRNPPEVGEDVDGDQREPDQRAQAMH